MLLSAKVLLILQCQLRLQLDFVKQNSLILLDNRVEQVVVSHGSLGLLKVIDQIDFFFLATISLDLWED